MTELVSTEMNGLKRSDAATATPIAAAPRRRFTVARVVRLVPLIIGLGFAAGLIIFPVINFVGGGPPLAARDWPHLIRLLIFWGGVGSLMSLSFFLTCGVPAMYLSAELRRYPKTIAQPLQIAAAFAGGLLGFALPAFVVNALFGIHLISDGALRFVLIADGALSVVIVLIIGAFNKLRADVRRTENLLYQSKLNEQILAERTATAQLRALQAQINPHFFFNTLTSIAALVNIDSVAAKEMILRLSAMYRYTLRCSTTNLVTLEDELDFVRSYLGIESVRFVDRLHVQIDTPPQLSDLLLPGLVLQPIAENAVKHGIARNVGSGRIHITVKRTDASFSITVANTAERRPDLRPESVLIEGHGLKNVSDRLHAVYGTAHEFNFTYADGQVIIELRLPRSSQGL